MKRYIIAVIFVLLLASCKPVEDAVLEYKESDFVFEVNQEDIDVSAFFDDQHTLSLNTSEIEFDVIGEYTLYVRDLDTEEVYEIPVVIQDTIAPEIVIPEDFEQHYDVGEDLDLSEITVTDNSLEEITYTTNLHEIDMDTIGVYSLVITAQDSTGNLITTSIEINVRFVNYPMIEIQTSNISNTSFSVEFIEEDIDEYKLSSSYRIILGSNVVQQGELTDTFSFNITGLLQNTEYFVEMEFEYQIPGEELEVMTSRVLVTTLDLFVPIVELDDLTITMDTLSFVVDAIDPDDLLEDLSVTVRDQNELLLVYRFIDNEPLVTLEDLNFGQEYTIEVSYSYDLADGEGLVDFNDIYVYQLIEKSEPIISVVPSVSYNDILVTVGITDIDLSLQSISVEIFDGETLIASANPSVFSGDFDVTLGVEAAYASTYQIVVSSSHILVMGEVVEVIVYDLPVNTDPMPVVSFETVFDVFSPGEDIQMEMEFDNPNNNHIAGVQINGVYYGDDRMTIQDGVYTFEIDGTDIIGTYQINLEKVYYSSYDVDYTDVDTEAEVQAPLPVIVFESTDYNVEIGQSTEISIEVENSMVHPIVSVTISGVEYIGDDLTIDALQSSIQILVPGCGTICNIEYVLEGITFDYNGRVPYAGVYEKLAVVVHYADEAPSAINTRQDLIDICTDPDGSYYLNVDIDLAGENWNPLVCSFTGYIDGNNHSILNMTITSTFRDAGLFEQIGETGYVRDLSLTDVTVNIDDSNNTHFGTLAGIANGYVQNVTVTGGMYVRNLDAILGDAYIGGLVGSSLQGTFNDVTVLVDFDIENSIPDVRVGGIFGNLTSSTVYRAHYEGRIDVTGVPSSNIGGIVGRMIATEIQVVSTDASIYVDTSETSSTGGIVGYTSDSLIRDFSSIEYIYVDLNTGVTNIGGVAGLSTNTEFEIGYAYGVIERSILDTSTQYIAGVTGYSNTGDSYSDIVVLVQMHYFSVMVTGFYNECNAGYITASNSVYTSGSLYIANRSSIATSQFGANTVLIVQSDPAFDILITDQIPEFFEEYADFDLDLWNGWDETRDIPVFTWYE